MKRLIFTVVGMSAICVIGAELMMNENSNWKRNQPIVGEYDKTLAVKCNNGTFVGKIHGSRIEHRGIPYAEQPVGELRWKAPIPAKDNDGAYEAYDFGPRALQFGRQRVPVGEDCLSLNVFRKKDAPKRPLPVMVWVHGGAWINGSSSDTIYSGMNFLQNENEIVYVSINYRLGAMGYLTGVSEDEAFRHSANLGLLDAACALKWVKRNIAAFGGDPENITAFGESAGAGTVAFLPFVAEKGTVHKIIAQSGSIAMTQSVKMGKETTKQLYAAAGAKDVRELMKLSTAEIFAAMKHIRINSMPIRDGVSLPEDIWGEYRKQAAAKGIALMIGTNSEENNLLYAMKGGFKLAAERSYLDWMSFLAANTFDVADWRSVREFYDPKFKPQLSHAEKTMLFIGDVFFREGAIRQAEVSAKAGVPTYMYYMTQPVTGHPAVGCCHATDLAYLFNCTNMPNVKNCRFNLKGERPCERECEYNGALATEMREMWFNFAKTGNPSSSNHQWPQYDETRRQTMVLGPTVGAQDKPEDEMRRMLSPMLKYSWESTTTYGGLVDVWHNK